MSARFVAAGRAVARTVVRTLVRWHKLVLVAVAALAGLAIPGPGDALAPLTTPIVVFLVFGSLRDARTGGTTTPRLATVAGCLGVSYVVLPAVAALLGRALLSPAATTGVLVAVAAPATAGSAIVWTRLGDGDAGLAAVVALVSIVVSPLATPVILSATLTADVSLDATLVVRQLLVVVGGAVALFWLAGGRSLTEPTLRRGSLAAVVALVYLSVASSDVGGASPGEVGEVAVAALAVLAVGLALAASVERAAGIGRPQSTAIFFSSSLKNLGIGLTVAGSLGVDAGPAVSVTVFYVVQQLASGLVAEASA